MARIFKSFSALALASMLALPMAMTAGDASAASCGTRKFNGTVLGAAGGALLGDAVTRGSTGPIVGGLAGAVVGREIGRSGCRRVYYRSSRPAYHRTYRSAPARYYAPPEPVRKVHYYDEYGRPYYYR